MYSLNVPVPGSVRAVAADLAPRLLGFDRVRDRHSLVVKRFESARLDVLRKELDRALRDEPAFEARVTGVDYFADPPVGSAPVVYLAVESPGLRALHERLVDEFGAVEGLEGPVYAPHVTLARGGSVEDAEQIASVGVDPVAWTVRELHLWSREYRETVSRYSLPR